MIQVGPVTAARARLAYLAPSVASSLYRNGKVFTRRDRAGSDDAYHGAVMEEREVAVHDARGLNGSGQPRLDRNGFELLRRPLARPDLGFYRHRAVVEDYYIECAGIVKSATGAGLVLAFDHNIRWAAGKQSGKRVAGGQQVQAPIHVVHGDYTLTSAPQRLRDLARPPGVNDTLRGVLGEDEPPLPPESVEQALDKNRRFAFVNVWRSIDDAPVARDPLALCDGLSAAPEDLVVFEIHYTDRVGENYFAKYSPSHRWWYYPRMTRDEVLLIKQWDSAGTFARSGGTRADSTATGSGAPCTFSFHSAFSEPGTPPDAPQRQSIEVRCVALF